MPPTVRLRWKVTALLGRRLTPAGAFNTSPNTGLFTRLGIPPHRGYVPTLLLPTITYHQAVRNELDRRFGVRVVASRFPYRVRVETLDAEVSFVLKLKLFPPTTLLLDVELEPVHAPDVLDRLIAWQRLETLRPISDIVRWTIGMVDAASHRRFDTAPAFRYKPAVHLDGISPCDAFRNPTEERFRELVGVLIRNPDHAGMDVRIPRAIAEKNAELNRKSAHELLLVDKQGLLYVTQTHRTNTTSGRSTFAQVLDLHEIAVAMDQFLRLYPSVRLQHEDFADFLLSRVVPWIRNANAIFAQSVTSLHAWRLLVSEFGLEAQLELALTDDTRAALPEKQQYFDRLGQEWWRDPDFGEILRHRILSARELPLQFLANADLARLVGEDYAEAKRSLQARNYKSTILLCGSIAEAMLTAALGAASISGLTLEKLYRDYVLDRLIDEAAKAGLLTDRPLQSLLQPLRQYRNMIHPGVQVRRSLEPDSSKATIALETVKLLAGHLAKRSAPPGTT